MSKYRLSKKAAVDIRSIAAHIIEAYGILKARQYRDQLSAHMSSLAHNPTIGRLAEYLVDGLRRSEVGSHVIFYTADAEGILIVRILHQTMDPTRYL